MRDCSVCSTRIKTTVDLCHGRHDHYLCHMIFLPLATLILCVWWWLYVLFVVMMKMVCVLHNVYTAQCPLPSADLNFPPILPQRDSCGLRDGAQELKSLLFWGIVTRWCSHCIDTLPMFLVLNVYCNFVVFGWLYCCYVLVFLVFVVTDCANLVKYCTLCYIIHLAWFCMVSGVVQYNILSNFVVWGL